MTVESSQRSLWTCSYGILTEVLNVLISEKTNVAAWSLSPGLGTGALSLVDNDAVCQGSGEKRGSVGELSHASIVVESNPRQAISDCGEDQGHVSTAQGSVSNVDTKSIQQRSLAFRKLEPTSR